MNKDIEQNPTVLNNEKTALPTYLLSMRIANYRCFGPEQMLDLSQGEGIPAQWTIILGDNGVGKTTVLQCLSASQVEKKTGAEGGNIFYLPSVDGPHALDIMRRQSARILYPDFSLEYNIYCGNNLNLKRTTSENCKLAIRRELSRQVLARIGTTSNLSTLLIYGYGASRRIGKSLLSESHVDTTSASLFSDDVDLLNAEEWLLSK